MINKLKWISEEKQIKELNKRISKWKKGFSKDGYIISAEGKFVYRGIAYLIKVLRYFDHTNKFNPMCSRISDKHAVVEYPKETKPIVDLVNGIEDVYDFLYHDTLHSYNDNQTIEEQIELCHKLAKGDIDNLLDGNISKIIDKIIKKLQSVKVKVSQIPKEFVKKQKVKNE